MNNYEYNNHFNLRYNNNDGSFNDEHHRSNLITTKNIDHLPSYESAQNPKKYKHYVPPDEQNHHVFKNKRNLSFHGSDHDDENDSLISFTL